MTLKLSKTAIRELKARFRAVIIATLVGSGVAISTSAGAATITIPETDGNVTGSGGATGTGTEYTIVDGANSSSANILTESAVKEAINTAVQGKANTSMVIDLGNSFDNLDTRVDNTEAAISNINTALDGKQASLTTDQLAAVDSGVTADTVAQVATNTNDIADNAGDIATNTTNINKNANDIVTNKTNIATNATNIANNTQKIDANTASITANATAINENAQKIAANTANIATNTADIEKNETAIDKNIADIASNTAKIGDNATAIANNATAINQNTSDISENAQNIASNTAKIGDNATAIANNATAINQNTSDISENAQNIASNTAKIGDNATAIANNADAINQNTSDISENAQNIASNTANITTNRGDIATNTADIAALETNLNNTITQTTAALNNLVSETNGTITFRTAEGIDETTAYTAAQTDTNISNAIDTLVQADSTFTGDNTFTGETTFGTVTKTTIGTDGSIVAGKDLTVVGNASFESGLTVGDGSYGITKEGNATLNTITAGKITGTSLSVGTGSIEGGSLVLSGTTVDGIDTGSNLTDATGGATLATNATVYNTVIGQAENADYTGTKVTGGSADTLGGALAETNTALNQTMTNLDNLVTIDSTAGTITITDTDASTDTVYTATKTDSQIKVNAENADYTGETVKTVTTTPTTLKEAVSTTTAALNNVLNDAGEVDSAKVDVQWNRQDSTLQRALGTGELNEGNKNLTAGADVTSSLNALDATIGNVKELTGSNLDQGADKTVESHLTALDKAIGDRTITSANTAINAGTATDVASGLKAAGDAIGTADFSATNNASTATDLTTAITSLDTAIGDLTYSGGAVNYAMPDQASLSDAIQTVNANIGTAVTGANGNIDANNSINANLDSLDTAIGNRQYSIASSTNYEPSTWSDTSVTGAINQVAGNIGSATTTNYNGVLASNSINANIDAINATIGDMSQMQNRNNNLAQGSSVVANLDRIDAAIGNRAYTSTNYIKSGSDLSSAVSSLDSNLSRVEDEMNKMDHEMRSGFASLAALSALVPNARSAGDTQLSLGTGYYRGTTGFAVGAFHHVNDNILLNAGAAYGGNGSTTFRSGVTFGF